MLLTLHCRIDGAWYSSTTATAGACMPQLLPLSPGGQECAQQHMLQKVPNKCARWGADCPASHSPSLSCKLACLHCEQVTGSESCSDSTYVMCCVERHISCGFYVTRKTQPLVMMDHALGPDSEQAKIVPDLLKCCPDISRMFWQVALGKCEESCKDTLVRLTVCTHGCHLSKHPCHLLTGECRVPASLQECKEDAAVQRHAIHARI